MKNSIFFQTFDFWPPFSIFEKNGISAFTGKKINVVTILDQNLVRFEICNEKSNFQIFTWYSWKSRFSTIYKLEILKTAKILSRTAMTLIFCSSERWDSILFKNSKGGQKGGQGNCSCRVHSCFESLYKDGIKKKVLINEAFQPLPDRELYHVLQLVHRFTSGMEIQRFTSLLNFWPPFWIFEKYGVSSSTGTKN